MVKMIIWDLIGVVYKNGKISEDAKSVIDKLKGQGIKHGTISNTSPELIQQISKNLNLEPALSTIELGMGKKEKAVYEYFLEKTGLAANECLFIDDHHQYLEVAKELGMHTVFYGSKLKNIDYVINDLNQIIEIVNNIN